MGVAFQSPPRGKSCRALPEAGGLVPSVVAPMRQKSQKEKVPDTWAETRSPAPGLGLALPALWVTLPSARGWKVVDLGLRNPERQCSPHTHAHTHTHTHTRTHAQWHTRPSVMTQALWAEDSVAT